MVVCLEEMGFEDFFEGQLAGGVYAGHLADSKGQAEAGECGDEQGGGSDVAHGLGGGADLPVLSLHSLEASDEHDLGSLRVNDGAGNDGEGEDEDDFAIDAEVE